VPSVYDEYYGTGFVNVNEILWSFEHATPYPFTVTYGEISCGYNPTFGSEVYFMPKGFTDESYIGIPLNQAAVDSLKLSGMSSNVPYSIKKDADLNAAIEVGISLCDEKQKYLKDNI